jgi:hypothetical protein
MRWDFAWEWINWRVRECLRNEKQGLEPEDKSPFAIMPEIGRPAVHINHGEHFTTHYKCYEEQGETGHNYWSGFDHYWPV